MLKHQTTQRLFLLIAMLWIGSLLAVGYLVVPTLFSTLTDRQVAGMVAAAIFQIESFVSLALCAFMLIMANILVRSGINQYRMIRWILLGIFICALIIGLILIPWMDSLRETALLNGMPVMQSPAAGLFSKLHGSSSLIYLTQSILGILMIWKLILAFSKGN